MKREDGRRDAGHWEHRTANTEHSTSSGIGAGTARPSCQTAITEDRELKPEGRGREAEAQVWWRNLSQGERRLICSLMGMLRGAKRSQVAEVARAAAKWERGLGCFIKVRLIHERPGRTGARRRLVDSGWVRIEGRGEELKSGKLEREIGTGLTVQNPRSAEV